MKRFFLSIFVVLFSVCAYSQIDGDGYYRVSNLKTERYVYVTDNTGSVNVQATTAEMGALQLWKDHSRTYSDPASIIYIEKKGSSSSGDYYDLQSQGTGIYAIIGYYVYAYSSAGTYQVYAEGKYLSDDNYGTGEFGSMGTKRTGDYRRWVVTKVDNGDEFFGITPSVEVAGRKFHPFFADFGFRCASEGMTVWYISTVDKEGVVVKKITDDIIPARTPVFIECASSDPSSNRLELVYSYAAGPDDNKLKGVYFNNSVRTWSNDARTAFDSQSMRVLGVMEDGTLGYVLSTAEVDSKTGKQYLAANQSYLTVDADIPDEVAIITEQEYASILLRRQEEQRIADSIAASVKAPVIEGAANVFMISGRSLGVMTPQQIEELPAGVYIINRRKVVVK